MSHADPASPTFGAGAGRAVPNTALAPVRLLFVDDTVAHTAERWTLPHLLMWLHQVLRDKLCVRHSPVAGAGSSFHIAVDPTAHVCAPHLQSRQTQTRSVANTTMPSSAAGPPPATWTAFAATPSVASLSPAMAWKGSTDNLFRPGTPVAPDGADDGDGRRPTMEPRDLPKRCQSCFDCELHRLELEWAQ